MRLHCGNRSYDARVRRRQKANRWQQQNAGIEDSRAIRFDEGILLFIESLLANITMDRGAKALPLLQRRLETELFGAFDRAIERHPCHDFRRDIMLSVAADFPNAAVP